MCTQNTRRPSSSKQWFSRIAAGLALMLGLSILAPIVAHAEESAKDDKGGKDGKKEEKKEKKEEKKEKKDYEGVPTGDPKF